MLSLARGGQAGALRQRALESVTLMKVDCPRCFSAYAKDDREDDEDGAIPESFSDSFSDTERDLPPPVTTTRVQTPTFIL